MDARPSAVQRAATVPPMPPPHLATPLLLAPVLVPKPWGGHRLHDLGRHDDAAARIGETWDVTDLPQEATPVPDPVSRVVGGAFDGTGLDDLRAHHREALLGDAVPSAEGRFPLLVKLLDAAEHLSVQVHPPRALAPTRAKTESWVVIDSDPGAVLYLGVQAGVTIHDVRAAAGTGALVDLLGRVEVTTGDVLHVPAGTIHALGAGVLVAEVQTPSDITHRLWDWPEDRDGGRELHIDAGLAAIEAGWEHNEQVAVAPATDGTLVSTEAYVLARETLADGGGLGAATDAGRPRVCIVLAGGLRWTDGDTGAGRTVGRGGSILLPAASTTPLLASEPDTQVLVATPT